ncbi:MAG: single-stranded-DNA-specific exonuclease RecJ, partial [Spirochaetales bacterium]
RLLLSENPQECESLIREITALNEERKKVGEKIWDTIMPQAEESLLEFEKKLVLVSGDNIHRGVTGILATRLLQYFRTTAIVVAFMGETVVGSMRSKDGFNVKEFLDSCSEVFYDYGGHDCAAGFSMPREKFDVFKNMVSALVKDMEPSGDDAEKEETLEIDAELPLDYVNPDLIKAVDFFAPYGEANRPLVFLTRGILIKDINIMGKTEKQHVKFLLDTGKFKWPALFWNASGKVNVDFSLGDKVDIVFRVSRNYYQNAETLQLTVLDLKR